MHIDTRFSELLGTVYEGALEDPPWHSFLSSLRELMRAANTTLVLRAPTLQGRGVLLTDGGSAPQISTYNERLFVLDPFVDLPPGQVKSLLELVNEEDWLNSELYQVCMAPAGLHDSLAVDVLVEGDFQAGLRAARGPDDKPFSDVERELFRALIPHLRRALVLHARLGRMETERALYAGAVAQLSVATIILDEQGKVLNTNPLAAELLAHSTLIRLQGDSLVLNSREQTRELRALVASLVETQRRGETGTIEALRIPRGDDGPDMGLVIRPIPLNEWSEGQSVPSVAIFISVPDQIAEAPVQVITRLFGFTPTEATLALLLANGLSLDEAAADMGVSRNTARTHLRALFSKTGVTRQTLLVRLILKSVAALA